MKVRCIEKADGLTVGKEYIVEHIENLDYEFKNDAGEDAYYDAKYFKIIEAKKVRYLGEDCFDFLKDHEYIVLGEHKQLYSVVDESGDDYMYPKRGFELIDED